MSVTLQAFKTRARGERRPEKSTIAETRGDRVFLVGVKVMLWIALIAVAVPLVYVVANSFSSASAVSAGRVLLWPVEPSLRAYREAFGDPQIMQGYLNSFIYAIGGTLISVTLTIAIAYPLSRPTFFGRNVIMSLLIFTMLFSGGLIPTYLVVQDLHLLNTRWAMVIPSAIGVWQVIIARTFFRSTIPDELYEAATLDGAGDLRFLWSVVLPLSKPVIAVIALMYAIFQWNKAKKNISWDAMAQYNITLAFRNEQVVPSDVYAEDGLERRLFQATKLYAGHEDKAQWFPQSSVWPDPSLGSELATLQTNLNSYVSQGQLAFITGSKNIDTDWDAWVKGLDSTGMTRYLEIQQQAYDKYKSGK